MPSIPTRCPGCSGDLEVTRADCPSCDMHIEGRFVLPALLKLPADDLDFVLAFVRASGSLKAMAKLLGHSYPTIRNRLDAIIEKLAPADASLEERRHAILDAIARGEMTVQEGVRQLEEVGR